MTYLFVLKIDCSRSIFKVTITSFKSVVACRRSALNPVWVILMCIGVEILSENRLRRRSCVTKVRTSALYMYLDYQYLSSSLFVSLSVVCLLATLRKISRRICMKFTGQVGNGPVNK